MALMLLTFLGLTLATTTSTELQIATNYRWSQQALYNAEAGIEAGKQILRNIPVGVSWATLLPSVRAGSWTTDDPVPPRSECPCIPAGSASADDWGNPPQLGERRLRQPGRRRGLRRRPERHRLCGPRRPHAEQDRSSSASA